jgi:2-dehydropantoate 2-reductase
MRFIVYGIGAIGGTLAVKLTEAGHEVLGIARGAQLEAIKKDGLRLRTPAGDTTTSFPVVAQPSAITFRNDDIVFLTMKTQDTRQALEALRLAGAHHQPVVCMQNGVANETMALRYFDNVFGAVVMMPATYLVAGEVIAFGMPKAGIFDIGCFPHGLSPVVTPICDALNTSGFAAFPHENVMRGKYGKLLLNLANGIDAALGADARDGKYAEMARAEARAVYEKAGIAFDDVGSADPRREKLMEPGEVPGAERVGSSSAQSLKRAAGSVEVDYLNGEIACLGRLHGVPAPVNAFFCALAQQLVARNAPPGSLSEDEVEKAFAAWTGRT